MKKEDEVERRYRCYNLAALMVGPLTPDMVRLNTTKSGDDAGIIHGHNVAAQADALLAAWADTFHLHIYGSPMPKAVLKEQRNENPHH